MNMLLSIVIIGRNEEKSIEACISAAQTAAAEVVGSEIIYVDSASSDRSAELASAMGVRVLRLAADRRLCPSAGRFVGARQAHGEFILFLDADTLVYPDFVRKAITQFRSDSYIAGVNGRIDDLDELGEKLVGIEERYADATRVKWLRGPACMYRSSALRAVGSFDPHLAMEEEAELGLRLGAARWKLYLIPVPMACHTRCYNCRSFSSLLHTFKRDIRTKRLGEITRTMATAVRNGYGLAFLWLRLKTTVVFVAWLLLAVAAASLPTPIQGWVGFAAVVNIGLLFIMIKKRSPQQAALFIADKILIVVDVLAGVPKILRSEAAELPSRAAETQKRLTN